MFSPRVPWESVKRFHSSTSHIPPQPWPLTRTSVLLVVCVRVSMCERVCSCVCVCVCVWNFPSAGIPHSSGLSPAQASGAGWTTDLKKTKRWPMPFMMLGPTVANCSLSQKPLTLIPIQYPPHSHTHTLTLTLSHTYL